MPLLALCKRQNQESDSEAVPPEVVEMREATHPYEGQDTDELTFDKGAVIQVLPYADPEDEV